MFNIILIILLLSSMINYIRGNIFSVTLNCGIWAYIGKDNKEFSSDKFNILGIINDSRGKDASGILIDNSIFHKTDSYYELIENEVINSKPNHPVVLGHSRKASSGGKLVHYAQPFVWSTNKNITNGLIHNGTIHNELELSKKYNVPDKFKYNDVTFSPNDTQILAHALMVTKNTDILLDYRGAAALVWEDRDKGETYLFKGKSKYFNRLEEERPLFVYEKENGYIWVSSIEKALTIIADEATPNIYSLEPNTIITIKKGVIISKTPIDRINKFQTKSYTNNNNHSYNNYDYENMYNNYDNYNDIDYANTNRATSVNKEFNDEMKLMSYILNYVEIGGNRYYTKGKLAEGLVILDEEGNLVSDQNTTKATYQRYFKDGILIKSQEAYTKLIPLYDKVKSGAYIPESCSQLTDIDIKLDKLLSQFSVYPVALRNSFIPTFYYYNHNLNKTELFTGSINPIYSNSEYVVVNGYLTELLGTGYNYKIPKELEEIKSLPIDIKKKNDDYVYSDDENEWMNDYAKEQLSSKLKDVINILNSFENEIFDYEDTTVAASAQKLLDNIKSEILTSEFNVI